ncbi:MAG: signal peptidase I [Candidatus Brocadiia bacterium]
MSLKHSLEWARSNLEIFIVAFVMAMLIRCFCIEVFKIPSGSMEPTLHGDMANGDRIIANKFGLYFHQTKRFDVILFKYPLNKSTNFIKRVVGLPDEELLIHGGDLYSKPTGRDKFTITRKRLDTQQAMWIPAYEWDGAEGVFRDEWDVANYGDKFAVRDGRLSFTNSELSYRRNVRDHYPDGRGGRNIVPDIKLAARFRMPEAGAELKLSLNTVNGGFTLFLRTGENSLAEYKTSTPPTSQSFILNKVNVKEAKDHLVECMNFDGMICVLLDGREIFRHSYMEDFDDVTRFFDNKISIGANAKEVTLWDLRILRDVYYSGDYDYRSVFKEDKPVFIPKNKYVVFGDNVPNSKDSRLWTKKIITLKDGRVIECDPEPRFFNDDQAAGLLRIQRIEAENRGGDIWGLTYEIKYADIVDIKEENSIFVDKDEIFGCGIMVYWPPKRVKIIN